METQPTRASYSLHSCVHDWAPAHLHLTVSEQLCWYAVECVAASIDKDDWEVLGQVRYGRLAQHRVRCVHPWFRRILQRKESLYDDHQTLVWIADLLAKQVQLLAAEQMCLRALAGRNKALGPDHASALDTVNNLGSLYKDQGKLEEAEKVFRRVRT